MLVNNHGFLHIQLRSRVLSRLAVRIARIDVLRCILIVDFASDDVDIVGNDVIGLGMCQVVDESRNVGGDARVDGGWKRLA